MIMHIYNYNYAHVTSIKNTNTALYDNTNFIGISFLLQIVFTVMELLQGGGVTYCQYFSIITLTIDMPAKVWAKAYIPSS